MGAALPPTRAGNLLLLAGGLWLCLSAAGANSHRGGVHSPQRHPPLRYAHVRSGRSFYVVPPIAAKPAALKPPTPKPRIPTAASLYPKTLDADDLYSYRGRQITTYWRSGRAEAVVISHRAPNLRRIDYLAPDAERGRSVVTDEAQEWQYDPRGRQLLHRRLEPGAEAVADAAESYDLLRTNYILGVVPQVATYADRRAFILTVTRKSVRTLARKLWIDAATGLVLKRESYREDGKLALTVAFSDVNFHSSLPRSLFDLSSLAKRPGVRLVEKGMSSETPLALTFVRTQLGGTAQVPTSLNGYRLVSAALTRDGRTPLLHLRYSDGLNLVSLFEQRRVQRRRPTRVPPSMRPTRIGRRDGHESHRASLTTLNWDTPTLNLTLMGEIAESSLRELALAADPQGEY